MGGNEGSKCLYNTRLDVYGCGCYHDCSYCYAKTLLDFRGLWNPTEPRVANLQKIEKAIKKLSPSTIVRLGGMSDCFQPVELTERATLNTIKLLNEYGVGYLIVTKSHIVADEEYLAAMNPTLAHIQVTVTSLDDKIALSYEKASASSKRIDAIMKLQDCGFDVAIRLSPLLEEYIDFDRLNELAINKCIVEFLRVNSWIKKWFPEIDYNQYTLRQSNYNHLPLADKLRILDKIKLPNISICEDVTEHYKFWRDNFNPNQLDCCNLRS